MNKITTRIKRRFLAEIVTGTKKIEYREIKPYWACRLEGIAVPFELRLINGMSKNAPEVTLLIGRVDVGKQTPLEDYYEGDVYRLHIKKILSVKNWLKS
jgi:hypothetical protein